MNLYDLIIDFEATCWEKKDPKRRENEIIEIGYVIGRNRRELLYNGSIFVKPIKEPILSEFCINLTKINQIDIDSAKYLQEAMAVLSNSVLEITGVHLKDVNFISWGNFDKIILERECKNHAIEYPFSNHTNLKALFMHEYRLKTCGLTQALSKLGLTFKGTLHRGKDDALNIWEILKTDSLTALLQAEDPI
jgi:3'-5' exoribonuclease 1